MKAAASILIGLMLLSGCTVGPKYNPPAPPAAPAFKEAAPAAYSQAPPGTWAPAQPQDGALKGKWWEIFKEPELNALEEQLNIDNQNIAQYFQNFMAARAQVGEARAGLFPTLTADPSFNRSRSSGSSGFAQNQGSTTGTAAGGTSGTTGVSHTTGNTTFNSISLPFDVAWEPDLWGRVRNGIHEFQYAAQVSAADLENERLTEQADLAIYYFELRGQDALQDLYNRTVEADRKALELTHTLVETGIDSPESEAQADVTLRDAEAQRVGIATNRAIYEHAIATLIGKPASDFRNARQGADHAGAADSRRGSLAVAAATARHRGGGTHHGAGERAHRRGNGGVLPVVEPHGERRSAIVAGEQAVFGTVAGLVDGRRGVADPFRRRPAKIHTGAVHRDV